MHSCSINSSIKIMLWISVRIIIIMNSLDQHVCACAQGLCSRSIELSFKYYRLCDHACMNGCNNHYENCISKINDVDHM